MPGLLILLIVVVAAVLLCALAWWSSGRARAADYNELAAGERGEAEAKAMRQYRPTGGYGPGPVI